jgi:spore coat polysaccharide biosynthesis predicted glycosyltransferase SpsG
MKRLLVAVLGDRSNGMGHISREMVLARALALCGVEVIFETQYGTPGAAWLVQAGWPVTYQGDLRMAADGYLIDVENGPSRQWLDAARADYPRVIVVAGTGYGLRDYAAVRDLADLEVYQGLDAAPGAKAISGAEYILIDPAFRDCRPNVAGHICLNYGGADPHNLTGPSVAALAGLERRVVVVVGPAAQFTPPAALPANVEFICAPPSLRPYLAGAALFVGAFGTVVWEACAASLGSVMYGWSRDHVTTQARLQALGVGRNLGLWDEFDGAVLRVCVESFLSESKLLPRYYKRARELVDGGGAARVAEKVAECLR